MADQLLQCTKGKQHAGIRFFGQTWWTQKILIAEIFPLHYCGSCSRPKEFV